MGCQLAVRDSSVPKQFTINQENRRKGDTMSDQKRPTLFGVEVDGPQRQRREIADLVENSTGMIAVVAAHCRNQDDVDRSSHGVAVLSTRATGAVV